MGQITTVFPCTDGAEWVASVKAKHGETKRVVSRVCILPIDE